MLLAPVPHRQVVLTLPKRLRAHCLYRRALLGDLARVAARTVTAAVLLSRPRLNFLSLCDTGRHLSGTASPVAAVAITRTATHSTHAPAHCSPPPHGPDCAGTGFGSRRSGVQIPAPRFCKLLLMLILHRTLREMLAGRFSCRKHRGSNWVRANAKPGSEVERPFRGGRRRDG
jgi:hypothetical protein